MDLIAHRGFAARHPENTRGAVRAAASRAAWVEVDVRRCRTGEAVVIHDATLDRVTGATGPVADCDPADLAALSVLDSGEGVPTLAAVLEALPAPTGINVELKEPVWAALDRLRESTVGADRVLVSSFDADTLRGVAERSGVDTAYLTDTAEGALSTAVDVGCVAVHPHHSLVDAAFVEAAHDRGLAVNAWTVTERSTADRLRATGVDGVIADHPDVC